MDTLVFDVYTPLKINMEHKVMEVWGSDVFQPFFSWVIFRFHVILHLVPDLIHHVVHPKK